MIGAGAGPRKLDLTKDSVLPATAKQLWPLVTDVARWPAWFRDGRGQGLERVTKLPHQAGAVHETIPELGQRFRFAFTNGLEADFQVTYWTFPSQISLGLVPATRASAQGVEGFIVDCDLFPLPDGSTKLWFGALLLLEPGFRPSLIARWPKRDVMGWVEGFHARLAAEVARGASAEAPVAAR